MHLTALHIHPVKSLRGMPVSSARVDSLGLEGDRRFLVVDPSGKFLTQRTHPQMATVAASLTESHLTLASSGRSPLELPRAPDPSARLIEVSVWGSSGLKAEDCGEVAAQWITGALGLSCRMVRIGAAFVRPVKPGPGLPGDRVSFADAYPMLVTTEASLRELNRRISEALGDPVPMNRFRPNLVLSGSEAFAEDSWKRIRIGNVVFRSAGPCARCIMTTTDQTTGQRGHEPLKTLAAFRRDPKEPSQVNFGQNLVNETKEGVLTVGDAVEVLE